MATSDKLSFPEAFEIGIAGDSQTTDSVGSRSDYSGKFQIPSRPRMDVICVIDFQNPKHDSHDFWILESLRFQVAGAIITCIPSKMRRVQCGRCVPVSTMV